VYYAPYSFPFWPIIGRAGRLTAKTKIKFWNTAENMPAILKTKTNFKTPQKP
jgi:hypothetical protein